MFFLAFLHSIPPILYEEGPFLKWVICSSITQGKLENFFTASSKVERWGKIRIIFLGFMPAFGDKRNSSFYDCLREEKF
jgi:hypothetical protein